MPFTAQVVFTGLGMVVIRADEPRSRTPRAVELLLLGNPHVHQDHDSQDHHRRRRDEEEKLHSIHLPKITFQLADVSEPIEEDVPGARVDADGAYVVDERIDGADMTIEPEIADGNEGTFEALWAEEPTAERPGDGAPEAALDWIPDINADFGVGGLKLPGGELDGTPFVARVRLPPGYLSTRQLFRSRTGGPELFEFGLGRRKVMAEQWVWTRSNLTSLSLPFPERQYQEGGREVSIPKRKYVLDDVGLRLQGMDAAVRVAVTNLPAVPRIGRGRLPEHFHFLATVEDLSGTRGSTANFSLTAQSGAFVTIGGTCPPTSAQVKPSS
ncbi:MAG: hypothetical protein ACRDHY_02100 [Anaerolineales bacterium]